MSSESDGVMRSLVPSAEGTRANRASDVVQRGYTGPTDEINQYFTCAACGRVTFELIAKTARET